MYDNKTLTIRTRDAVPRVCVCVRACVCVCVCAARSKTDKQRTLLSFGASKRSNTHKTCKKKKTAGLKSIHLNTVYILKWQTASSMLIKEKITHSSYSE